jgi:alpha/beta superfamily hydrolase
MHGNAGNLHEGLTYAPDVLPLGIDLLAFDFSGCGNSEGEWVTLGWKEKDDLHAVL